MFENKKPKLNFYLFNLGFYWQRGQDSNLREIALKLISSQPRYDHFDTSPFLVLKHLNLVNLKTIN